MSVCIVTKYMPAHHKIPDVITQIAYNMVYVLTTKMYPIQ